MTTEKWVCIGDIIIYGNNRANPFIVTGVLYDDTQGTWVAELKNLSKGTNVFMDCWNLRRYYRKLEEI
jgi:hypothetical protein